MGHRFGRRADDPLVALSARLAWRAEDAVDNGARVIALPSYIGDLRLVRNGTGQVPGPISANFFGRRTVPFSGAGAGYSASLPVATSMSFVNVYRVTAVNSGVHAFTVGGGVNTGNSSGYTTQTFSQKVASAATRAMALTSKVICVSVFTAAGVSHYANQYTPVSVAPAGALVGNTLTIGALDTAGTFTLTGEWLTTGYFDRALTAVDAAFILSTFGAQQHVAIAA